MTFQTCSETYIIKIIKLCDTTKLLRLNNDFTIIEHYNTETEFTTLSIIIVHSIENSKLMSYIKISDFLIENK